MSAAQSPDPRQTTDAQRYPLGRFAPPQTITPADREHWIEDLEIAPANLRAALLDLAPAQLDTPYREGGWTARQVAHHLADSHLNAYIRFRLALTEELPLIKAYDEKKWAELSDARLAPAELSLQLFAALQARWALLLRGLNESDWGRQFLHPERGPMSLEKNLALYAWHGKHHTAQILALRRARDW